LSIFSAEAEVEVLGKSRLLIGWVGGWQHSFCPHVHKNYRMLKVETCHASDFWYRDDNHYVSSWLLHLFTSGL